MSVRGSLRTMSVEDVLDWIDRRTLSGTLRVEHALGMRWFAFDTGYLVDVGSSAGSERPDKVLARIGMIADDAAAQAVQQGAGASVPVAVAMLEVAELDPDYLRGVLAQHASESLLDTWGWDEGTFAFETIEEKPLRAGLGVAVPLRECLVIARQRAARWQEIRALIPRLDVHLVIVDRMRLAADDDAEDVLEEILDLTRGIDSGLTIAQLVEHWHGWRYRVLDRLALLLERGGATLGEAGPALDQEPDDAPGLARLARVHADARRAAKALELVERALALEPQDMSLQMFRRDLERAVFAELSRDLLTSFRVPTLKVPRHELDRLELSETERYLAGRVDGRWDLLSLMRVAPVREVEALITFKRLADRGIISL